MKYERPFLTDEEIDKIAKSLAKSFKGVERKKSIEETKKFLQDARKHIEADREMWRKAHEFPPDILTRRY